jgi:hypothetical protein
LKSGWAALLKVLPKGDGWHLPTIAAKLSKAAMTPWQVSKLLGMLVGVLESFAAKEAAEA